MAISFGIEINKVDDEARPAVATDMAVIGLAGTAPNADPEMFPINDPVTFTSDNAAAYAGLGLVGTLAPQLDLINAQLGAFQVAARVVFVRVTEGASEAETMANLVGNASLKTGIHAFRNAGPKLGIVPRLIGVPGFTHQQESGLNTLTLSAGGSGYTAAPVVTFTGGGGSGAAATATVVNGVVTGLTITNPGTGYTSAPTIGFTGGGGGTGAVAVGAVGFLANPVVAALPSVLNRLLAHAVASGPHNTLQGYTDWVETINSQRIIPVETWVKHGANASTVDSIGTVLGLGARRDFEKGGRPFHSWANQPIYGIVGPNRLIDFSLTDGSTEGQAILGLHGGVILRGEAGVEGAISSGGYMYVGTDVASDDPTWQFYNVTRGRDYIHLLLLKTLKFYLGRFNLTAATISMVVDTVNFALRDLEAVGDILGYKVGFERSQNNPDNLRMGRFNLTFKAEEAPVLRQLGLSSARYRPALDELLNDLLATLDVVAL